MKSYLELLKAKAQLKEKEMEDEVEVIVLNNITTNPLKEYLEYQCGINHLQAKVSFGDYDNILQNAQDFEMEGKVVIVFWELANCIHGLEYKIDSLQEAQLEELEEKIKAELQLTFQALSKASLVIFNRFSALPFTYMQTEYSALEQLARRLNEFAENISSIQVKWMNTDKCVAHSGIEQTIDFKGYLKNKVLYKHAFYWHYSELIQPYLNALKGKVNKLLAMDCDNSLWQGILGEDGMNGIAMDENTYAGQAYAAAQYRALGLARKGVLLALASKNNPEDVEAVLKEHPAITLSDKDLVAQKVNWEPKGANLKQLATELNIGADSFVFIDDSDFELELMQQQIPWVKCRKVPGNAVDYYKDQQQWANYFVQLNQSREDAQKLEQYKQNVKRASEEKKFDNFDQYLEALELQLTLYKNELTLVPRMAQMTQKTNQFNLTTHRYSESQIENFVKDGDTDCFALGVKDKFGDSGVTGLCIVRYKPGKEAEIDSLLMSCRILGRNIEYKFVQEVISQVLERSNTIQAAYIPTKKNMQVADFYEKMGFQATEQTEEWNGYQLCKKDFAPEKSYPYIKVEYA
jgi:FkbH-like protein